MVLGGLMAAAKKDLYNNYANDKAFTASSEELVLMLYDGALKFANIAIMALEKDPKDTDEKAAMAIIRVQKILKEFQVTLDRQYAISDELYNLYDYMFRRLVKASVTKNIRIVAEVRNMIRDLRDTWKQAMLIAKKEAASTTAK